MASTFSSDQKSHAGCDLNPRVLDIIHFNDVYNLEQIYTEEPVGGAAKYATFIQNLKEKCKKENRKPLILFSGDFVGPSLFSSVTHGAHVIDVLNHVGVDFATFGNHELDYGYASLKARLAGVDDDVEDGELEFIDYPASTAQWIMTNMTEPDTGKYQ